MLLGVMLLPYFEISGIKFVAVVNTDRNLYFAAGAYTETQSRVSASILSDDTHNRKSLFFNKLMLRDRSVINWNISNLIIKFF